MSNRVYLKDVHELDAKDLAALPIDQLDLLISEAADQIDDYKLIQAKLDAALAIRFAERTTAERHAQGKDTGTVRLAEGDYEVVANLPKRVKWDSNKLPALLDRLPPDVANKLAKVEIKIDERAFLGLPDEYRAVLLPARTVETGRASYELKPLAEIS